MAEKIKSHQFDPGQVILRENTPGDSAYIILSGEVEITKIIEGQRVVLDTLGPGSIFGEMSLLDGSPRSATVTAKVPTLLSIVDRGRFQAILNAIPKEVRPLFSALSDRLRHTSRMVSVLSQRERLLYSICVLIHSQASLKGIARGQGKALSHQDTVLDACRVLAIVHEKIVDIIVLLASTSLIEFAESDRKDDKLIVIPDPQLFGAFIDFLSEKLSYIPGFPLPTRKYSILADKAQEILFFLKNTAGALPTDEEGYSHYDFDRYVKDCISKLGYGVKDAILLLQNLSVSGHVRLEKFSKVVQNKAIVYNAVEIAQAQMILLQADEFEKLYNGLKKAR